MNNYVYISIVMATYNGAKYLREQLDSIISQDYPIYEIIISDDSSSDNTVEIIQEYIEKYRSIRISLYKNNGKHGIVGNFLNGFQHASGDWIAPSDQDDIWLPNKLSTLVKSITDDIDCVYGQDCEKYDDGTTEIKYWLHEPLLCNAIWKNDLKGHTCIFRKDRILPLYNHCSHVSWDYVIWLYTCTTGRITALSDILVIWRRHPDAVTFGSFHKVDRYKEINNIHKKNKGIRGKWRPVAYSLTQFMHGRKSLPFQKACRGRSDLLEYIYTHNNAVKSVNLVKHCSKMLKLVSKQTPISFICSSFESIYIHILSGSFNNLNVRNALGKFGWAFREPFVQWFNVRNEKNIA